LKNKPGRLAAATRILGDAGVNIRGFSIADHAGLWILRLLVDRKMLRVPPCARIPLWCTRVSDSCHVPDRPGVSLACWMSLPSLQINVETTTPSRIR